MSDETKNKRPIADASASVQITWRAFVVGALMAMLFAFLSVKGQRYGNKYTTNQIPVLPFVFLFVAVALINPVLRRIRLMRPLASVEILMVFIMTAVSAAMPTLGTGSYLVPIVSGLYTEAWNTDHSRRDFYSEPFVSENLFISRPGMRASAMTYRKAELELESVQRVYRAARYVRDSRKHLVGLRTYRDELLAEPRTDKAYQSKLRMLRRQISIAELTISKAESWWETRGTDGDPIKIAESYKAKVEALIETRDRLHEAHKALKVDIFAKVAVFRRGLPDGMRAIPGWIYVQGEGVTSYYRRVQRLAGGLSAFKELRAASKLLAVDAGPADMSGLRAGLTTHLDLALARLAPLSDVADVLAEKDALVQEMETVRAGIARDQAAKIEIHRQRRLADVDTIKALNKKLQKTGKLVTKQRKESDDLKERMNKLVLPQVRTVEQVAATHQGLTELRDRIAALTAGEMAGFRSDLQEQMYQFRSFDASMSRFIAGDIPWRIWFRPLLRLAFPQS